MDPKICPYLGLIDDPNTSTSFPYEGNACYRAKKPTQIALSHQRGYCLSDEHTHCPGYVNGWADGFPRSLQGQKSIIHTVLRSKWAWAALAVIVLVALYFIFPQEISAVGKNLYSSVSGWFDRPAVTEAAETPTPTSTRESATRTSAAGIVDTPTPTNTNTVTNTVTFTPTSTVTLTPTETSTPTRTATATRRATIIVPTDTDEPPPPPPPTNTPRPTNTPVPTQPPTNTPVPPTETPIVNP
jgi:hypothetical protein